MQKRGMWTHAAMKRPDEKAAQKKWKDGVYFGIKTNKLDLIYIPYVY